ncbi:hypothetical protein KTE47_07295 [Burkholderia multivorans]|uniref:hypothetical protein n=1 Tax=Burkholderia multivorans TaxID=87883 RepID=UPI001C21055A|nr:hypothetical protein [Burkholderia multivorans]MBU9617426.1 hypothetical protein [Burkholderia multivorans]
MLSSKRFAWIAFVLVVSFVGLSVRGVRPGISGDGLEYTLMAEAFLRHGTPNITEDDYRSVRLYKGDVATNVPGIASGRSLSTSPPFFRDSAGRYYSYHFWLYSLFVAPFLLVIKLLGLATSWAFVATNVIFSLIASSVICLWRDIGRGRRLFLLVLYWSCGTIPYISWTHPEVFSASLLVVSIVAALSCRYVIAAITAALVAQQNPPVLILVAIFLAVDLYVTHKKNEGLIPPARKVIEWVACIALASLSTLFYYIHFRVGSLIAHSGFASVDLISAGRLWSFYFDLNQGLLVLLWPLLAIMPAVLVSGLISRELKVANCILAIALVCISIMLAVPSISTTNFNSGASFVMRYAYWASVPILFSVVMLCAERFWSGALVCAGMLIFVAMNVAYYAGDRPSYVYYTHAAEKVMGDFPRMYNPIPEIFVERGLHIDGATSEKNIYYYAARGDVRKILLNSRYRNVSEFKCANGVGVANYVNSIYRVEQGWSYFNLKHGCAALREGRGTYTYEVPVSVGAGDSLLFREGESGRFYLSSGWSRPESWGTWSDAREATIVLPLTKSDVRELSFTANALVTTKRVEQVFDIFANGVDVGSVSLTAPNNNKFDIHISDEVLSRMQEARTLKLKFKFRDPVSPKDLGINDDDRTLALGLVSLTVK